MCRVLQPEALPPPTNVIPRARLLAYRQALALERWLHGRKRGLSTLVLSLLRLTVAWWGIGRPYHLGAFADRLLVLKCGLPGDVDQVVFMPRRGTTAR